MPFSTKVKPKYCGRDVEDVDHHMRPAGEKDIQSRAGQRGGNDKAEKAPVARDRPIVRQHMQGMQPRGPSRDGFPAAAARQSPRSAAPRRPAARTGCASRSAATASRRQRARTAATPTGSAASGRRCAPPVAAGTGRARRRAPARCRRSRPPLGQAGDVQGERALRQGAAGRAQDIEHQPDQDAASAARSGPTGDRSSTWPRHRPRKKAASECSMAAMGRRIPARWWAAPAGRGRCRWG